MTSSWRWWFWPRRPQALPNLRVVVYTRSGCHLCDDALTLLAREQAHYRFQLETIDVDSEPELAAKYGECVPVVTIDGKVRFRSRVNAVLIRRLLEAEARQVLQARQAREQ